MIKPFSVKQMVISSNPGLTISIMTFHEGNLMRDSPLVCANPITVICHITPSVTDPITDMEVAHTVAHSHSKVWNYDRL